MPKAIGNAAIKTVAEISGAKLKLPTICHVCLGPKQEIRVVRDSRGGSCRLCSDPFPTYRWKIKGTVKVTHICTKCADRAKICQCCTRSIKPKSDTESSIREASDHVNEPQSLQAITTKIPFDGTSLENRPEHSRWLFIAGIEPNTDINRLRSSFHSSIERLNVVFPARFAVVEFSSPEEAEKAGKNAKQVIDGTRLRYRWATEDPELNYKSIANDNSLSVRIAGIIRRFVKTDQSPNKVPDQSPN